MLRSALCTFLIAALVSVTSAVGQETSPVVAAREFSVQKRYLNIPIRNGAPKRTVRLVFDGKTQVQNQIELADEKPDWWAVMEVAQFRDRVITLEVDGVATNSAALAAIEQGDNIKDGADLYRESLRGQFHFSPARGWNNDPNGLVYFNGEYHLFFQHNPYSREWGNMHWGHAVSRDLVHWTELGEALLPDTFGPMFSGSAVVDWKNTSGLGLPGRPPMVLIYTAAGNPTVQCVASTIDGRRFTKYTGNPVLSQISSGNRDPKVMWHQPSGGWVKVLYVALPQEKHTVHFFTSTNLLQWSLASITEGGTGNDKFLYECPDFFELPVDGNPTRKKWVLFGANSEYAIGTFDGTTFTPEASRLKGHNGRGFYAPQTFSDLPNGDNRRILIGWFQTPTPGMSFNQSMTIPIELKLQSTADGPRLTWTPVRELHKLRAKAYIRAPMTLAEGKPNPFSGVSAELLEVQADFEPGTAEAIFNVRGATVAYRPASQELEVNGHRVRAPMTNGSQQIRIFCDRIGLEVFASGGFVYVPMPFIPKAQDRGVELSVKGGDVKFTRLDAQELQSAWSR